MKRLLETLYVVTPDSYVYHRNENICVSIGGEEKASMPVTQIDSIVSFGSNTFSASLLGFCSEHNVTLAFLDRFGNFEGRLCGKVSGNVLLRKRQYDSISDERFCVSLIKNMMYAKIANSKNVLMRQARTTSNETVCSELHSAAVRLSELAAELDDCCDTDSIRGKEGAAASVYFAQFDNMLSRESEYLFERRSRRPPQNEVNAVLSFLYTMLTHDAVSALETVGLDPAAGYMHTLRPGRASLALDLIEELRAPLCDRLTLTMFNKRQLGKSDFDISSQAVYLSEQGKRKVLHQWRTRKQDEIQHPFLKEKINIGMILYVQAMLLARVLRGDLDQYPPFVWR